MAKASARLNLVFEIAVKKLQNKLWQKDFFQVKSGVLNSSKQTTDN